MRMVERKMMEERYEQVLFYPCLSCPEFLEITDDIAIGKMWKDHKGMGP